MFIVRNGKTEVDEGGADAGEAGVVVEVSMLPPLPTTSGKGDQMLTNTDEKDAVVVVVVVVVATMEITTGVGNRIIGAIVSREEGGDAGDMARTPITDGPLLTMGPIRSLHLHHNIQRTRHRLSPLPRRIHSPLHPFLDPP